MKDLLGYNGISKSADQILEGTLFENLDEECFPGVKEFIVAMATPPSLKISVKSTPRSLRQTLERASQDGRKQHPHHQVAATLAITKWRYRTLNSCGDMPRWSTSQ